VSTNTDIPGAPDGEAEPPRVVLITGAASGIGLAAARLYLERGHRVVAVDVDKAGLDQVAEEGEAAATLVGDTADDAANEAAVALALDRFGRLDAVVLNAGIGGAGPLEGPDSLDRLDRVLAVNVHGVASGIRAAIPALRAAGGGAIVATSSVSGLRGDPGTWAYNASKAAIINLVRGLAVDYAAENIRINAIAPGGTVTGLTAAQVSHPSSARRSPRASPRSAGPSRASRPRRSGS
jgi:meso-butanediol dehydrogenase/(S,S)-butanediol dehydrogenase/diacetyl reductase